MSGGRPCGLPSNERWLADVSYLGTPPRVPACAGTTVVQRYSSAGTTGVEPFTSSTLEELLAWPYTPASSTILATPPYTSS